MKTIKIWNDTPSEKQLSEICSWLDNGEIMIWPTDTVYAIACDALNVKAVDRICRIKGINPEKSNLSLICADIAQAAEYTRIDNRYFRLMKENTPGAFTFLLRAAGNLPKAFKSRKTVGIRIPDCNIDTEIARFLNRPVMTTSIQYEDDDEAISPSLIAERYEGIADFMIEGEDGTTDVSTIIDCLTDTPEIIREGKGILK